MKRLPALLLFGPLLLASCGSGQFSNPLSTALTVTATPNPLTATSAQPGVATVTATDGTNNVTGLSLKTTSVPSGLNVSVAGPSVTVTPSDSLPAGTYPVTLEADVAGGSGSVVLQVAVTAKVVPSYTPVLTPATPTTAQGTAVHVAVTFTADSGYSGKPKVVRVDGASDAVQVAQDASGVTLTPAATAAVGSYAFVLVTTDGSGTLKSTPFTLAVTAASSGS